MIYAWYNNSIQDAHIKHSNDNIQKAYIETHRYNKVHKRFNHIPDCEKGVKNGETNRKKSIVDR